MSTFKNSEAASTAPSADETGSTAESDESRSNAMWPADESNTHDPPQLEMNRCPACGGRRFVSKLLVYEVTSYDEAGVQEYRRQHVRAEFEFACGECQTPLRTLPADRRDYYDEVQVLAAERRAALRDQLHQLCDRVGRRLWATKSQIALVMLTVGAVLLLAL